MKYNQLERFRVNHSSILSAGRLVSLDALRGFDMFWIMGGYSIFTGLDNVFHNRFTHFLNVQLEHSMWTGFTCYDIIMPLFLFLAGTSLVFSLRKRLASDKRYVPIWRHTIKRVLILWVLGMIVQGRLLAYDLQQVQLFSNTLQAIAAGYLIATILVLYLPVTMQMVATGLLMILYSIIVAQGHYLINDNIPLRFDHLVLGHFHDGLEYTWIISSLNFGATTMLGVFCGYILQSQQEKIKRFQWLLLFGVSSILAGLLLNPVEPIIKKIWTSSFVLFSGGICILLLALFYLVIDCLDQRRGIQWLVVIGSNAIFAYVAWHLFEPAFTMVSSVLVDGLKQQLGGWYNTVLYTGSFLVIFLLLRFMYRHKIFIKI